MPYNTYENFTTFLTIFLYIIESIFMSKIIENLKNELEKKQPFTIKIKVVAKAKQNGIEFFTDEIIKVKINKPAVDGKANKAIIDYFSNLLNLPKTNITITRGEKSSLKDLRIIPKSRII